MSRARATAVSEADLLQRRIAHAQQLVALFGNPSSVASQTAVAYLDLVDDLLIDIAQEVHREVATGVTIAGISLAAEEEDGFSGDDVVDAILQQDHDMGSVGAGSLSSVATAAPPGGRGPLVDVFGRSHPAKATDVVLCKNCGRQVQAGSFAPHLEKCMGKGRAAARNASRRIQGLL